MRLSSQTVVIAFALLFLKSNTHLGSLISAVILITSLLMIFLLAKKILWPGVIRLMEKPLKRIEETETEPKGFHRFEACVRRLQSQSSK